MKQKRHATKLSLCQRIKRRIKQSQSKALLKSVQVQYAHFSYIADHAGEANFDRHRIGNCESFAEAYYRALIRSGAKGVQIYHGMRITPAKGEGHAWIQYDGWLLDRGNLRRLGTGKHVQFVGQPVVPQWESNRGK